MKRAVFFLLGLSCLLASAAPTPTPTDLKSLVEAERAFSKLSAEKGIRTAFLANLAPDAIVFRPLPVSGRKVYEESPEIAAKLIWRPAFADISRAGDLGYTTGPYELIPGGRGAAPQYGHYVTVWRIQPDGSWKVVIDVGNSHPRPAAEEPDLKFDEVWMPTPPPANNPDDLRTALIMVDVALGLAATRSTGLHVLASMFAEDVRAYRPNHEPFIGRAAAEKSFADLPDNWTWVPKDGAAAASADLGYTFGSLKAGQDEYSYFRIWKGSGRRDWRLVLDLISPVPAKSGT